MINSVDSTPKSKYEWQRSYSWAINLVQLSQYWHSNSLIFTILWYFIYSQSYTEISFYSVWNKYQQYFDITLALNWLKLHWRLINRHYSIDWNCSFRFPKLVLSSSIGLLYFPENNSIIPQKPLKMNVAWKKCCSPQFDLIWLSD